jgi:signal transduction histidine kinase/DNA-binding NarL/FixJ family response regulator
MWIVLVCLLLAQTVRAAPAPLAVGDNLNGFPLIPRAQILEDAGHRLSLESTAKAPGWHAAKGQVLNFGISHSTWWLRVALRNTVDHPLDLVLDTGSTQQDRVDWYVETADGALLAKGRMGDRLPFGQRPLKTRTLALPLHLSPGQAVNVFLRLDTHDGLYDVLPVRLSSRAAFMDHIRSEDLLLTLFHGGLLVLILLSLALLVMIQDKIILYYTLYLITFLFYSGVASGFDLFYLWPDHPRLHNTLALYSGILAIFFGNAFGITLVQFRRHVPLWLWRLTQALGLLTLLGLIPVTLDFYLAGFYWTFFGLALCFLNCAVAIRLAWRGVPGAGFMCAGFAALIGGVTANQLQLVGYSLPLDVNIGAIQLGAFLQIMIFAMALAQSLRRLAVEKMQAEAADQAKAAFLATMSHEIRTPLSAILGFAQLALSQEKQPRQRGRLDRIVLAGRHLLGLINDILDFTKIVGGHMELEDIPFEPRVLLSDIREMLGAKAAGKGLLLEVEADDTLPRVLKGDPLRLRQILLNFTTNAIKFSETGTIHVRLRQEPGTAGSPWLRGEVADQGIGMEAGQADKLFSPFTQADQSISRRFGGTGLGLAISKGLAEAMGGTVGLRTNLGAGSVFWFRIPARLPDPAETEPPLVQVLPDTAPLERLAGRRVLLVDDNELNRLVSREFLEAAGMEVDQAPDGFQAIERLTQAPDGTYDLVLMDMMMPVLDGLEATRRLRAMPRFAALPIVAMTANAGLEDAKRCEQAGMNAHLAKPINEGILWSTLARFLPAGPPSEAESEPGEALFDPDSLRELRDLTSQERFDALLTQLIDDCEARGRRIAELARRGEVADLRKEVHDLISNAGNAGLDRLVTLGQALRQALHQKDTARIRSLAEQILAVSRDATRAVREHFRLGEAKADPALGRDVQP